MATPGNNPNTSKDQSEKDKDSLEPPAKMIQVDELESSIEKILERTLRKATQEQGPTTSTAIPSNTGET